MAYPPDFLQRVDEFIRLANKLAEGGKQGEASAAILFAAGRYNAFNFLSNGGSADDQAKAVEFYVSEYRKAFTSNLAGEIGPLMEKPN
jgi:ABC-type glycerol-3-phosphate transport system substrate-binding protein